MMGWLAKLAALSLGLLTAALLAVWVASYFGYLAVWVVDDSRPGAARWNEVFFYRGKCGWIATGYDVGMNNLETFGFWGKHHKVVWQKRPSELCAGEWENSEAERADWQAAGASVSAGQGFYSVMVPVWATTVVTGVVPSWVAVRGLRRRRWLRSGRCVSCGYDLSGNLSGVCPECGENVATAGSGAG